MRKGISVTKKRTVFPYPQISKFQVCTSNRYFFMTSSGWYKFDLFLTYYQIMLFLHGINIFIDVRLEKKKKKMMHLFCVVDHNEVAKH